MKRRHKIIPVFFIVNLVVMFFSISLSAVIIDYLPFDLGFRATPLIRLLFIIIICSIVGAFGMRRMARRSIGTIIDIKNASSEIAKGNYNIRVEQNSNIVELREMTDNFNFMARELAANEMMKNDFISNVSHEFKTPLSVIEGYATLLSNEELESNKVREYASSILANSKRLTTMTGNILLLSTLDNSKIVLNKKEFSLDEQLRETILLYENQWTKKSIELDIDMEEVNFKGDRELLSHVWQNLFSNAVKFCEEGGKIAVTLQQSEKDITVSISNTGIILDKEAKEHVFDKFYQSDTSRATKGNGLGLPITKRVVELHGGKIEVQAGETTCFIVTLNK